MDPSHPNHAQDADRLFAVLSLQMVEGSDLTPTSRERMGLTSTILEHGLLGERIAFAIATVRSSRWARVRWILTRVIFGALLLWVVTLGLLFASIPNTGPAAITADHAIYMAAARRWMAGGSFYQPYQLAGPYTIVMVEILYPPTILPLLVVFAFLPDVLWWLIPIAIVVAVTIHWRPSLLGWTLILACMAVPITFESIAYGNPGIWIAAFVALATVYGWPAVLVVLKPTLAPFMLLGIRRPSWWVALGLLGLVSLAFLPLWGQYLTVLMNARGPLVSPLYSLNQAPVLLIPVAAWVCRRRKEPSARLGLVAHAGGLG
jgi:hypothetical protein